MTSCGQAKTENIILKKADKADSASISTVVKSKEKLPEKWLDTALYSKLLLSLSHNKISGKWPVKTEFPLPNAILPFNRVVTYYGNFYSKGMGILGELPANEMLEKLTLQMAEWAQADTLIPVIPALEYIAVTAQGKPGKDKKYRLRMPFAQIDKALQLVNKINGILFIDIQVGHSTLQQELPPLLPYLKLPNVHLAIDPEYSMKGGEVPCSVIGTFDAEDINFASNFLAGLVTQYALPSKILVVHRFTQKMVTNYKKIATRPQVQIVMCMDGFGFPAKKIDSYQSYLANEPVQFTGFKIFYKQDIQTNLGRKIMTPAQVLKLTPRPIYIQYQ